MDRQIYRKKKPLAFFFTVIYISRIGSGKYIILVIFQSSVLVTSLMRRISTTVHVDFANT